METMTKKARFDPFEVRVSPLGMRRRSQRRAKIASTILAVASALVLFFSSTVAVADVEPPADPALPKLEAANPHELSPRETFIGTITGYSSDEDQTDDTPEITASGERVGVHTIACPSRYSFGTRVEIFGKLYICNDRMAKKFRDGNYFDLWFPSRAEAIHLGRVRATVKVLQ